MAQCHVCSALTHIKLLFLPLLSCVHAGYLSAVTIPAGAHSVVIREDPLNTRNFLCRCTAVFRGSTPHHTHKCSTVLCWLECKSHLQHPYGPNGGMHVSSFNGSTVRWFSLFRLKTAEYISYTYVHGSQ